MAFPKFSVWLSDGGRAAFLVFYVGGSDRNRFTRDVGWLVRRGLESDKHWLDLVGSRILLCAALRAAQVRRLVQTGFSFGFLTSGSTHCRAEAVPFDMHVFVISVVDQRAGHVRP